MGYYSVPHPRSPSPKERGQTIKAMGVLLLASLQLPSFGGAGGGLSVYYLLVLLNLQELYLVEQ